jgi:hypothetical protein
MSAQQALALPLPAASNTVVINARCSLRVEADQRVIVVGGLPVHHYRAEDAVAEAYAMVFLVESAFAQQMDVARAFGRSVRTVRRRLAVLRAWVCLSNSKSLRRIHLVISHCKSSLRASGRAAWWCQPMCRRATGSRRPGRQCSACDVC